MLSFKGLILTTVTNVLFIYASELQVDEFVGLMVFIIPLTE